MIKLIGQVGILTWFRTHFCKWNQRHLRRNCLV